MNILKSIFVVAILAFAFGSANANTVYTEPPAMETGPGLTVEVVNLSGDLRIIYIRVKTVTGAPIPGASVHLTKLTIPNESYTFVTNAFGEVTGQVIAKGPYVINVTASGFEGTSITIPGTSDIRQSFTLTPTH